MVKFSVVALSFFIFFSPAGQAASKKSAPSLPAPIQKALNSCKVPKGDFSLSVIPLSASRTGLERQSHYSSRGAAAFGTGQGLDDAFYLSRRAG